MGKRVLVVIIIMILSSSIIGCNNRRQISESKTPTVTQIVKPTISLNNNNSKATSIPNIENPTTMIGPTVINIVEPMVTNIDPNVQTNFVYGGKVARDESYQYFVLETISNPNIGLCKMESDGGEFSILCEGRISSINVTDQYIYFILMNSSLQNGGDIFRINKDGTGKTELLKGDYKQLMLIESNLYFLGDSDYKIYRMNCDGTGLEIFISDKCDTFLFSEGFIYTSNPKLDEIDEGDNKLAICKYDIVDGSKKTMIAEDLPRSPENNKFRYFIYKDKILFINEQDNNKIYIMNNDGTDMKKLNDISVESMVISEDGIIYAFSISFSNNMDILSFNLSGDKANIIYSSSMDFYDLLGIADDYIYFINDWGEGAGETGRIRIDGTESEILENKLK